MRSAMYNHALAVLRFCFRVGCTESALCGDVNVIRILWWYPLCRVFEQTSIIECVDFARKVDVDLQNLTTSAILKAGDPAFRSSRMNLWRLASEANLSLPMVTDLGCYYQ